MKKLLFISVEKGFHSKSSGSSVYSDCATYKRYKKLCWHVQYTYWKEDQKKVCVWEMRGICQCKLFAGKYWFQWMNNIYVYIFIGINIFLEKVFIHIFAHTHPTTHPPTHTIFLFELTFWLKLFRTFSWEWFLMENTVSIGKTKSNYLMSFWLESKYFILLS